MTKIYEATNLQKYYGAQLALNLDHFSLDAGQALVVEGPNGSGKSTFLRLLAFLEQPTSGTLRYFGSSAPRQECTLLLQEPWLFHETVFANVVLGLKLRGQKANLTTRYQNAMTSAGFAEPQLFAKRKPTALSGGEKQRVALASRLILNPKVLLLDEPTAHVDRASSRHIIQALLMARGKGATIICATHEPELAESLHAIRMSMPKAM